MTDAKSEKENRDPAKKRSIIRGIVIVFLVILLILTFFSNTIMNKSLAQVTTSPLPQASSPSVSGETVLLNLSSPMK